MATIASVSCVDSTSLNFFAGRVVDRVWKLLVLKAGDRLGPRQRGALAAAVKMRRIVQVGCCESALAGTPGSRLRVRNTLSLQLTDLCGELVEALPRRGKSERGRLEPLGRSASRSRGWGQPSKVWGPARDHLSGRGTVRLPSHGGSNADEKNHHEADEGKYRTGIHQHPSFPSELMHKGIVM